MENSKELTQSTMYHRDGTITHSQKLRKPYSEVSALKHAKRKTKGYKFTNSLWMAHID